MKRFYVIFKNGRVYVVSAKYFGLWLISPMVENTAIGGMVIKSVQTYAFYDENSLIVAQFYYDDVSCISNEKPEVI